MRGFIQIQNLLERALMNTISDIKGTSRMNDNKKFPVVYLQQFPYPKYKSEEFVHFFILDFKSFFLFLKLCSSSTSYINFFILPIVVTLMWSGNIGLAIRNLIKEKEKFIEEVNIWCVYFNLYDYILNFSFVF